MNITINQYVGDFAEGATLESVTEGIKEDVKKAKLPVNDVKVTFSEKEGLRVLCNADTANLIRKRKDIKRFRCNIVGYNERKKSDN